ncbi:hypothetical protein [Actibacterium sp. 188UL27-1]|uniref:hypothetical protein n=1 Tax=Actibacterium sp. 188UL27-1 TaxID=2786961 RepID=UPI00195EA361|nr:hypothetical protein [Actibacterium sp. 188UL27-1]MBM7069079.1 hypothetical protein [Actibacterium sp. 188UL27-1]
MAAASGSPPVLLFYDGHERQAEEAPLASLKSDLRRHVRAMVNKVRGKQGKSGYYTWLYMLMEALEREGIDYRLNDFKTARQNPDQPVGMVGYPTIFSKMDGLPNPRLIGPGIFSSPLDKPDLFDDPRNRLFVSTCDWHFQMFTPFYGDRLRPWFGGFDVSRFPDSLSVSKEFDVMIYDKIYFNRDENYDRMIAPFIRYLEEHGMTYTVIRYGSYLYEDYIAKLKKCRSMAFFCHSETQGMAYQECLSLNVPIFAWDEGTWLDPKAREISDAPIPCTSVPYFDGRCGIRFKADTMMEDWGTFWSKLDTFNPRAFIANEMTLSKSAEIYMTAYNDARLNRV